jgi:hypothetical protein
MTLNGKHQTIMCILLQIIDGELGQLAHTLPVDAQGRYPYNENGVCSLATYKEPVQGHDRIVVGTFGAGVMIFDSITFARVQHLRTSDPCQVAVNLGPVLLL